MANSHSVYVSLGLNEVEITGLDWTVVEQGGEIEQVLIAKGQLLAFFLGQLL